MAPVNKGILIISPFFSPNIGGVETHLDDLTSLLAKTYRVYVHTYTPLTTSNTKFQLVEKHKNLTIYRHRWIGQNLFHKLEKYPILQFVYLTPLLFLHTFFWLATNQKKISTIHSHGFNAAFIGLFVSIFFKKRHIISTHAVYDHLSSSKLLTYVIDNSYKTLTLSLASQKQLISWGINKAKLAVYRYWIDLEIFKPRSPKTKHFSILFVGRLIEKKGVKLLVKIATSMPNIDFIFIGTGPLSTYLKNLAPKHNNIKFLGKIDNKYLPRYYSQSHLTCVPSLYQEGFGRVVMESVACGTPVLASNLGGLPEALDSSVAILVKPTFTNLTRSIKKLSSDLSFYTSFKKSCRHYALVNFSTDNIKGITKYYV